jgi:DHA1 family bicyclomycin/chloramphenicol resistance-like MFS transporter
VNTESRSIKTLTLVVLTSLLFSVGPITVDLSLPAMTAIQASIGSAAVRVELTLTAVFFGMAVSQFFFGAIADRYGRRLPLLISMGVYALAAVSAATASNLVEFGIARLIQAMGLGVAVVLARSVVVDVCDERTTARVFSIAVTATSLMTVLAPSAGGALLDLFGWRAIPVAMAVVALATAIFISVGLPETLPVVRRSSTGFTRMLSTYGTLLRNRRFAGFAFVGACAAAVQFTYNTGAPSALIEHHGMTPSNCGLALSAIGLSMAITSQINALLLRWYTPMRILNAAVGVSSLTSVMILVCVFTGLGGAMGLIVSLLLQIALIGFIIANSMAGAMSSAGMHAGAASALLGVMMFVLGTLGSALVGSFHDTSGRLMGVIIAALSLASLIVALRSGKDAESPEHAASGADAR